MQMQGISLRNPTKGHCPPFKAHKYTIYNLVGCKVLCVITKYARMTTYMWMFCEGFYLHKLIAASFAEQKSLRMFYFIGWVFPVFPVTTFSILRWYFADEE
ncbi:uncharacterized protein CDAR_3881 [Caerostris darwini]|uniref:G-protein coupled receptors family 2 profile 2 domain-containing protein n=1 Tax=Caerostris darwini TaxID=1538125 RepID=A0AAV4T910_9ARAC|nr:uncharacterized protein CDAR_3881 [Caerostris darwini]